MPVIVEPLEVPSSAERALAPKERTTTDVLHPVQYGIVPERITLPRPEDEILSGQDEDVSSVRDGYAVWGFTDPCFAPLRHLVAFGLAKLVFRCARDRRLPSPKPEYRFDNNRPIHLLEQTRLLSVLSWNPWPRRGRDCEHICAAPGGAVNTLQDLTTRIVSLC